MKRFPLKSITKIKKHSQQLDAESILINKSWNVFSDTEEEMFFMFLANTELHIYINGNVFKGGWILLANDYLLIDMGSEPYLYNAAFVANQFLALNLNGANEYLILIEEGFKNQLALNSIDRLDNYLENKYIIEAELEQRRIEKIRQETIRLEEEKNIQLQKQKEQKEQERFKIEKKFKIYVLKYRLTSFTLNIIYSLILSLILSVIPNLQADSLNTFFIMFLIFFPLTEYYVDYILVYKTEFDNFRDKSKPFYSMYFINLINRFLILVLVTYLKYRL